MTHGRTWNVMLRISSWHYVPCVQSGAGLLPESPQGKLNHLYKEPWVQISVFFLSFLIVNYAPGKTPIELLKMTWPATHFKDSRPGYKWGFNCMPRSGRLGQLFQGDAGNRHACCFLWTSLLLCFSDGFLLCWTLMDVRSVESTIYLTQENSDNSLLSGRFSNWCLPFTLEWAWFCSSSSLGHDRSGLDVLTRHRIIHTDIKPDNLLMSLDKKAVKLSDFGCLFGCKEAERNSLGDTEIHWPFPDNILRNIIW